MNDLVPCYILNYFGCGGKGFAIHLCFPKQTNKHTNLKTTLRSYFRHRLILL